MPKLHGKAHDCHISWNRFFFSLQRVWCGAISAISDHRKVYLTLTQAPAPSNRKIHITLCLDRKVQTVKASGASTNWVDCMTKIFDLNAIVSVLWSSAKLDAV
jgi:hypothetical protein